MTEITWTTEIPLDRAERIDPKAICEYLERNGWRRIEGSVSRRVYRFRSATPTVYVMLDRTYDDYIRRVQNAIVDISRVERRPIGDVLREFLPDPPSQALQNAVIDAVWWLNFFDENNAVALLVNANRRQNPAVLEAKQVLKRALVALRNQSRGMKRSDE